MGWIAATVVILCCSLVSSVAWAGGALDRFEQAHRPPSPSHDDEPKDTSRSSTSSCSDDEDDDEDTHEEMFDDAQESDPTRTIEPAYVAYVGCIIPPLAFACFHPTHRLAVSPYHPRGLYVEPLEPRSEVAPAVGSHATYLVEDWNRARWLQIEATGFRAMNEPFILSHDLDLSVWLGPVQLHFSWEHLYERVERSAAFDHLDILGAHLGVNALGPFVPPVELFLLTGASLLKGEAATPAFDLGGELHLYPFEPIAFRSTAMFSIFEIGPVLLDARWQLGVALGRFNILAGPRWLYQGDAQGFWGPSAAVATRL